MISVTSIQRTLAPLLNLLFPRRCVSCAQMGSFFCEACLLQVPLVRQQVCPGCLEESAFGRVCAQCLPQWRLDGLWVVSTYDEGGPLSRAIWSLKYRGARDLGQRLGAWMAQSFTVSFSEFFAAPVPLHPDRERSRGYNQSRLLAEQLPYPIEEILQRHRFTPPQARLSRQERLKNLKNSFSLSSNSPIVNKKIILIDDVCTTGATLNECARTLKNSGAEIVWGAVLARSL